MADIVEKLCGYARDDHERGCQGREYDCSCGYDGKRDPLLEEAMAEITRLRAALTEIRDAGPMTLDDQRWRIALAALGGKND